jgi:two-component sensor histidine kinase
MSPINDPPDNITQPKADDVTDDDVVVLVEDHDDIPPLDDLPRKHNVAAVTDNKPLWTVLVVDDEPDLHTVTRLALKGFRIDGGLLRLLEARSGAQARQLLQHEPDCAVVLLDVVMETEDAGLVLAHWIRETLKNPLVRIVLRTGQPGIAPEETLMSNYDIHAYYAKTEVSASRLRSAITSGVRAWRDLHTMHLQREALERAQTSIIRSLKEKETLLREIHHRVKNNLQIVSSLLRLQSEKMPSPEARSLIEESVMRVQSMALIHQHLYGVESLDRIDLGDYARVLAESLRSLLAPSVRLRIDAKVTEVSINHAIPAGLILNELLTNAFKYGITKPGALALHGDDGRTGRGCDVCVEVGRHADQVRIAVLDAGPGLPADINLQRASSIGLQLIRLLTRQLRGTLVHDFDRGSLFAITFVSDEAELVGLAVERTFNKPS